MNNSESKLKEKQRVVSNISSTSDVIKLAKKLHNQLTPEAREYLNDRGINDTTISTMQLGWGKIYNKFWITIPVVGSSGAVEFMKLRRFPDTDENSSNKYATYPSHEAVIFRGHEAYNKRYDELFITEGELDAIVGFQQGLPPTISSTAGAGTFKDEWLELLRHASTIYVCLDSDEVGQKNAGILIEKLNKKYPDTTMMKVVLPDGVKDVTDYFLAGHIKDDLLDKYATHVAGDDPLSEKDLEEITLDNLADILDTTIKFDQENKCIVFLSMLTAYTEADQLNVCLIGQSSSGKSYLAKEVAKFFPAEDVRDFAGVSPTAFKHHDPEIDSDTGEKYVNCERKILIFSEMPHPELLANLRSLLSHDEKDIVFLTTDKGKSGGNLTKKTIIRGFPSVMFCSANTKLNEQEVTRCLLLSPEVSREKIEAGVELANKKNANEEKYKDEVESDNRRKQLRRRVRYIKQLKINSVIIPNPEDVLARFRTTARRSRPRHQRDIAHLNSIIKAVALLNAKSRMDDKHNIVVQESDIDAAMKLWDKISASQMLGITPALYEFYFNYILPPYETKMSLPFPPKERGVTKKEISVVYNDLNGCMPNEEDLRKNILPTLEANNIISIDKASYDGRIQVVVPLIQRSGESVIVDESKWDNLEV